MNSIEINRNNSPKVLRRQPLRLQRVTSFVPGSRSTIPELENRFGLSRSEIRLLTSFQGLDQIATADGLPLLDMLTAAGEAALDECGDVRYLIHAHTNQHLAAPAERTMDVLRSRLRLDQARAFSICHQGCVIGLTALRLAQSLLVAEPPGSTALLLIGEKALSPVLQYIPQTSVMGEAIAAVLVGLDGTGDLLIGAAHRALGEYYESLYMSKETLRRYRRTYTSEMIATMLDALNDADVTWDDIDIILPHNANRNSWTTVAREIDYPVNRIYLDNIPKLGHCYGADPFLNLIAARAESRISPGRTILAASAGQGGTFSAAVLVTDDGAV
ncbi:3-oxoacyl-[acyl-carrier-protein] synthase-3 [Catenulispora sp. GP43]|uniref:3-oxoacyl-[acyl-carrier-protein] synthase III C-terminal domain-containing protein n=1 Tax=Catenulispora sp. GP43 TaxID=3156263 RepID=UPI003513CEAD